jgi:hypothetical protein
MIFRRQGMYLGGHEGLSDFPLRVTDSERIIKIKKIIKMI